MKNALLTGALTISLGAGVALAAEPGIQLGVLTCQMTDQTNLILYTNQKFDCTYESASGQTETYEGQIDKVGADLSVKEGFHIVWLVKAPTSDYDAPGALKGNYAGIAADAAVIHGGGAKLLVGGGENHLTLQPAALTKVTGAGVSVGIQSFSLN